VLVNHGGFDTAVAQQFLNGADVVVGLEQMTGETLASALAQEVKTMCLMTPQDLETGVTSEKHKTGRHLRHYLAHAGTGQRDAPVLFLSRF
jgi:hypothetical protein